MSAQPHESLPRQSAPVPRDAASVYAALPADRAANFRAELDAALDQARADLDLAALTARLDQIVREYWAVASAASSPRAFQAEEDSRRWRAGEEIDVIPAEQVLQPVR
jgi:hypothetical protein